ncbi:MAG: hypothetical protein QOF98_3005 [Streptomyces sp.]|jgi:hypothetical protein|nr:hypothetical protein [Streptomyces sp.]
MTHNGWQQQPGQWQAQQPGAPRTQEVELPLQLRGPFLREFVPDGAYKHRGAQIAAVVFYKNGGHSVITVRGSQHQNKPLVGRPTSVCQVARGRHQVSFEMQLPTLGDQADFTCAVDVNWEVQDFHLVAEKRVVDVEKMLRPPLLARLRSVTRRHGLDGAQHADEAIQDELTSGHWSALGADIGLTTEVFVRIDLGRAAADHNQDLVRVRHDASVQSAVDRATAVRIQHNLADARRLIEAGEAEQYAVLLAQDPSRANEILGTLQAQAKEQRQGALEYLTRLIDNGVVQRHQVEGQVQLLIDYAKSVGANAFENGLPQPATGLMPPPVRDAVLDAPVPKPEEDAVRDEVPDAVPPTPPAAQIPPPPPHPPFVPPVESEPTEGAG